jgi:hypothetical protein
LFFSFFFFKPENLITMDITIDEIWSVVHRGVYL